MKILILNYEFPPLGGGAGNAAAHIARGMAAGGAQVRVLTSAFGELPGREIRDGYEIIRVPALRGRVDRGSLLNMVAFMVVATMRALMMARHWKPDVSLAFFGIPGGPVALVLRMLLGVPYVVSLRGGDVPGFWYKGIELWHKLSAPLIRLVWRKAAAVVPNSQGLLTLAQHTADYGNMRIIPNGVDCDLFAPSPDRDAEEAIRFVLVGRMVTQKGVGELLEAFAKVKDKTGKTVRLDLVGDGEDREEFEALARRLGLDQNVQFRGWLDRTDVAKLLGRCDVFVLPSREEGMSNAILEAMASGLAVVSTVIPANEGLLVDGEHGVLVPPGDVRALSAALQRLVDDGMFMECCGYACRLAAQERHGWKPVAEQYARLCSTVVQENGTRRKTMPEDGTQSRADAAKDFTTAQAFADSWNNLPQGSVYTRDQFEDWLAPLSEQDVRGRDVLELGCGNGSLLVHMASWGPQALEGVDLGDSVLSARRNMEGVEHSNWKVTRGDLTRFRGQGRDLAYCIGVLHHLKDPEQGFDAVLANVKPGGAFHCWVYAREGNGVVIALVEPLRRLFSKCPWWVTKYFAATPLAVPFFLYAKGVALLPEQGWASRLPLFEYCRWIAMRGFGFFRHVAFDQLVTPQTVYLDEETLQGWMHRRSQIDQKSTYLIFRNGNSWKFGGRLVSPDED